MAALTDEWLVSMATLAASHRKEMELAEAFDLWYMYPHISSYSD